LLSEFIIDKEGNVKHVHFLGSFLEQAKAITDALSNGSSSRT